MPQIPLIIRKANPADETFIRQKIAEFQLDDAGFLVEQFLIAESGNEGIGIIRERVYESCSELCTLGVVENCRRKGVATELSKKIIASAQKDLYLVCIIPEFFIPLGFEVVNEYPTELADKLHRCETQLCVPEKYVVMKKGNTDNIDLTG